MFIGSREPRLSSMRLVGPDLQGVTSRLECGCFRTGASGTTEAQCSAGPKRERNEPLMKRGPAPLPPDLAKTPHPHGLLGRTAHPPPADPKCCRPCLLCPPAPPGADGTGHSRCTHMECVCVYSSRVMWPPPEGTQSSFRTQKPPCTATLRSAVFGTGCRGKPRTLRSDCPVGDRHVSVQACPQWCAWHTYTKQ